jgi:hypothetical protein
VAYLKFTVYSLRFTVYGLRFTVYGLQFLVSCFWFLSFNTSAHSHIRTSAHRHIGTSAHRHIRTSAHPHIRTTCCGLTGSASANYLLLQSSSITKNIEDARSSLRYLHVLHEKLNVLRVPPLCDNRKLIYPHDLSRFAMISTLAH